MSRIMPVGRSLSPSAGTVHHIPNQESPAPLPRFLASFVGREREIGALLSLLRDPGVHLLSLTGPTGATEEAGFSWTIPADALPEGDVGATFYRLTLPPAATLPLLAGPFCGCPGEQVKNGIGVELVESGTYAMRLNAPLKVVRAGAKEEIAAGTEVTLGPGDVARFPDYAAAGDIRNAGDDPVSVVGLAIVSQEATGTPAPDLPSEVVTRELGSVYPSAWRKLPPGPVTVTLRVLSLPPGAELAPSEAVGLETIHVAEGMLSVASIPAGESEPAQPLVFGPGSSTPFQSLTPGTRRVVSNHEDTPAKIVVLTISASGERPGTPAAALGASRARRESIGMDGCDPSAARRRACTRRRSAYLARVAPSNSMVSIATHQK